MQAHVHHSSGLEELTPGIQLEVVKHMGPEDKRRWRLVNKAACQAVYESTTALSAKTAAFSMSDIQLPLPLLSKCSGLKRLSCRGMHSLCSIHGLPPALEVLDISQTVVTDLFPLEQCTGLKQLLAIVNRLWRGGPFSLDTKEAVQQLSHIRPLTALQRLDLSCNLRGAKGAAGAAAAEGPQALALIFKQLPGLQHLTLEGNRMGPAGAQALSPAVQQLTGLQQLGMGGNDLGAEGAQALAPAILHLTGLRHLDMRGNWMGAEGAQALAPAIQQLTGLRHLDMGFNGLGAEGAQVLAPAIQQLTGLQHLNMHDNDLGVEGVQALAPAIQQLTGLQELDLQDCDIGVGGAAALAPVMKLLPGLRIVLDSEDRAHLDTAIAALP